MNLNGFSREAKELVHLYESYGWTFRLSSNNHAIGREPDGPATCSVPQRLATGNRSYENNLAAFRRWEKAHLNQEASMVRNRGTIEHEAMRVLVDFHPERVALVAAGLALGWEADVIPNGAIRLRRAGASDIIVRKSGRAFAKREHRDLVERVGRGGDPIVARMFAVATQEEWALYVMDVLDDLPIREMLAVAVAPTVVPVPSEPEPEPVDEPSGLGPGDRALVRGPWIASRGARRGYESKAVVEVRDGDEVVGYECSECGKSFDEPHATASHYRRAHSFRRGRTEQNPTLPSTVDYHPSRRLIEALAGFLADQSWDDVDELAERALTWMRTRPDLPEPAPQEPLTDAQIVERIRRLVGAEDHTEELDVLSRDLEAMEAENARLMALLAEADARADRLQADLDAWLSLAPKAQ